MNSISALERAREYVAEFGRGDLEALRDFYSDDVIWHVGGKHHSSGDYRGREAPFDYFASVRQLTGGTMRLETESVQANARSTAMFMHVTAQREGRDLNVVLAQLLKTDDDGKWSEYWAIADDQDAVDAFWA